MPLLLCWKRKIQEYTACRYDGKDLRHDCGLVLYVLREIQDGIIGPGLFPLYLPNWLHSIS